MRKAMILVGLCSVLSMGCAVHPFIAMFWIDTKFHTGDHSQEIGTKKGESCFANILGLVAVGDASVENAAREAGIKRVTSVDYAVRNYLAIYAEYCVLVTGE